MDHAIFARQNGADAPAPTLDDCLALLAIAPADVRELPFIRGDVTAGTENELQVAVAGSRSEVDLPLTIEASNYYANIFRRAKSGDMSWQTGRNLDRYLAENRDNIWENSWVRLPYHRLNDTARAVLHDDLRADKSTTNDSLRNDSSQFFFHAKGEPWLRIPVSYLLKLALADLLGESVALGEGLLVAGRRLMDHFLNDNTSPETTSFYVVAGRNSATIGNGVARETAKRYLFSQLLLSYANRKFGIEEHGQQALLFFSPHPPIRQRQLNAAISDSFYRELFMSPCLSGWDNGEEKHRYMALCHQVLSRSHMNAVMKLREAGIVTTNLVVLPHTSNISLANNGTHVSLGSRKLTGLMQDPGSGFTAAHEKYLGDLGAKIMEHFLPLFVGTYSAAPYRLAFEDFHPETALGFLPHQLDYTHLRMFWRRWKKKARNHLCGHALTPFGPLRVDTLLRRIFRLHGDFLPDFRLMDYPVSLLSTQTNCCQNGLLGNDERLKEDLDSLGVFDKRMALYQLIRLRQHRVMGFTGFEARFYSLFSGFADDLGQAADLQMLLTALTYKLIVRDRLDHNRIPGIPFVESERRQILFAAAVGLPTFFVRRDTTNALLLRILRLTENVRPSRRYPGYLRVSIREYLLALLRFIQAEGADLIDLLAMQETLADLDNRLRHPDQGVCGRLVRAITGSSSPAREAPFTMAAHDFNVAAEGYYRRDLRLAQIKEAWDIFAADVRAMADGITLLPLEYRTLLYELTNDKDPDRFLRQCADELSAESLPLSRTTTLLRLLLLSVATDAKREASGT